MMNKSKAIFFDRDGVVNIRPVADYVKKSNEFTILKDFLHFFKLIMQHDYISILITNQQGVSKKLFALDDLNKIHKSMQKQIKEKTGYRFNDIFFCIDLASANSYRRKPNPGMLEEAIEKYNIDKQLSYMIGDSKSDIIAGKKAGVSTILLSPDFQKADYGADHVFKNFYQVIQYFETRVIQ